ncbi:MAG: DNA repair protein RecO [Candidatus Zixiibacteriota bacterium]
MALEKSDAVVLKVYNWSESSRTAVFFTERFGKLPLVDKGGRSVKSKRGRLMPFAHLEVTFYKSEKQTSAYLRDCDIIREFSVEKVGSLGRLAYGSAASELLLLLLPEGEAQPALFGYFLRYLGKVSEIEKQFLPATFISFFLRTMSQLGYHPSLAYCVGCSKELERIEVVRDKLMFSPERGGLVCSSCQKPGEYYIGLSVQQARLLSVLQRASLDEAATVPLGFQEATILVDTLTKFVKHQSGLVSDIKSLEFLDKLKSSQLS